DGTTRHAYALIRQYVGNLAVAKWLAGILGVHQLLDDGAYRGGGALAAGVGVNMAGEEILQLVDATRGMHVLLRGDARYGGFVHAHRFGDVAQYQRFHGFVA